MRGYMSINQVATKSSVPKKHISQYCPQRLILSAESFDVLGRFQTMLKNLLLNETVKL